jgi:spermidine synthase
MSPFRLDYFQLMIAGAPDDVTPNRDFSPTCYREALILWSAQWHPKFREVVQWISGGRSGWLWGLFVAAGVLLLLTAARHRIPINSVIAGNVLVAGGATMVLQMVFLLSFQILEGFLYLQLALILSFFMAGLAAGAAGISQKVNLPSLIIRFIRVQALIGLFPLFLIAILYLLHGNLGPAVSSTVIIWLFPALSFIAGAMGGALFSLAVGILDETGFSLKGAGGKLYAIDLTGAAFGMLLATFLLLPVYGLIHALLCVSVVVLMGLVPFFFLTPLKGSYFSHCRIGG